MKKSQSLTEFATIEHISVTISQLNRDNTGKQVSNRTYWSIRKKTGKPHENTDNPVYKGSVVNAKSNFGDKRKKQKPIERFTQLSLFPRLK